MSARQQFHGRLREDFFHLLDGELHCLGDFGNDGGRIAARGSLGAKNVEGGPQEQRLALVVQLRAELPSAGPELNLARRCLRRSLSMSAVGSGALVACW